MKNFVLLAFLVGLVLAARYGWQQFSAKQSESVVRNRVEGMLRAASSGDEQTATCQWAEGKTFLSSDELARHVDAYAEFARAVGLGKDTSWTVDALELASSPPVAAVTINGRKHRLAVPETGRIVLKD